MNQCGIHATTNKCSKFDFLNDLCEKGKKKTVYFLVMPTR